MKYILYLLFFGEIASAQKTILVENLPKVMIPILRDTREQEYRELVEPIKKDTNIVVSMYDYKFDSNNVIIDSVRVKSDFIGYGNIKYSKDSDTISIEKNKDWECYDGGKICPCEIYKYVRDSFGREIRRYSFPKGRETLDYEKRYNTNGLLISWTHFHEYKGRRSESTEYEYNENRQLVRKTYRRFDFDNRFRKEYAGTNVWVYEYKDNHLIKEISYSTEHRMYPFPAIINDSDWEKIETKLYDTFGSVTSCKIYAKSGWALRYYDLDDEDLGLRYYGGDSLRINNSIYEYKYSPKHYPTQVIFSSLNDNKKKILRLTRYFY